MLLACALKELHHTKILRPAHGTLAEEISSLATSNENGRGAGDHTHAFLVVEDVVSSIGGIRIPNKVGGI